jgi:uncharacterized protein YegL
VQQAYGMEYILKTYITPIIMNKITEELGAELFSSLSKIMMRDSNFKEKIAAQRSLLYKLFNTLIIEETIASTNLYDFQKHFFSKYKYEGEIVAKSHELRKLCNQCVHGEIIDQETKETIVFSPTKKDYVNSILYFSEIISHFSDLKAPNNIISLLKQEDNKPQKNINELKEEDLFNNPDPRIPVVLVLDTSQSMMIKDDGEKSRIDWLNEGVRSFYNDVLSDERTKDSVEVCIVTFDQKAEKVSNFGNAKRQTISNLKAKGNGTKLGGGISLALELLDERKKEYQDIGVEYYQPWLVIMTDGNPTEDINEISLLTSKKAYENKLTVFPIGIGAGADLKVLNRFSPKRPAMTLKDYQFKEFFEWLHKSVVRLSDSLPGAENINIVPPKEIFV